MIYLLDLNFTLAISTYGDKRSMAERLKTEQYRQWLLELLRGQRVLIVTARPEKHKEATLARIRDVCKWEPEAAFFNDLNLPPPQLKKRIFLERIAPLYGREGSGYFGLESNPQTRGVYRALGILSCPVPKEGTWSSLPDGNSMPESRPSSTTCLPDLFHNMS